MVDNKPLASWWRGQIARRNAPSSSRPPAVTITAPSQPSATSSLPSVADEARALLSAQTPRPIPPPPQPITARCTPPRPRDFSGRLQAPPDIPQAPDTQQEADRRADLDDRNIARIVHHIWQGSPQTPGKALLLGAYNKCLGEWRAEAARLRRERDDLKRKLGQLEGKRKRLRKCQDM